jgi:His-Xaa-Ser system protein HxsD
LPSAPEDPAAPVSQDEAAASSFEMTWSKATTPLEGIERALYAMADQVSGTICETEDGWNVEIHPRSAKARRETLSHLLRQEVTDQALRVRIAERTDPIRNLVFALAFSRSGIQQTTAEQGDETDAS